MEDEIEKNLNGWRNPQEGAAFSAPASGSGSEPAGSEPAGAPELSEGRKRSLANLTARGRKPGQPNRITKTFKEAAEMAFTTFKDDAKGIDGGVEWLQSLMRGTASDRAAVLGLYGRLIPAQLQAQVDTTVRVELGWLGQRGIGRVSEEDVRSLDAPQASVPNVVPAVLGDVVEGVIVDAGQQGGAGGSDA